MLNQIGKLLFSVTSFYIFLAGILCLIWAGNSNNRTSIWNRILTAFGRLLVIVPLTAGSAVIALVLGFFGGAGALALPLFVGLAGLFWSSIPLWKPDRVKEGKRVEEEALAMRREKTLKIQEEMRSRQLDN